MDEKQAKKLLQDLLKHFTAGRILGLLGELYKESAMLAVGNEDHVSYQKFASIYRTLDLVGTGIDAKYPS